MQDLIQQAEQAKEEKAKAAEQSVAPVQPEPKKELTTYYAIQICAARNPMDPSDPRLKGVECDTIMVCEWVKYYAAKNTDRDKVAETLPEYKKYFPDCWIIKFER